MSRAAEQHYTVQQIAEMWHLAPSKVRRIFYGVPGVLRFESQGILGKRKYTTLRIPASVLDEVHQRRSAGLTEVQASNRRVQNSLLRG